MLVKWKVITFVVTTLVVFDLVVAVASYNTRSENLANTRVVTGWDGVVQYALIFVPLVYAASAVWLAIVCAFLKWAEKP